MVCASTFHDAAKLVPSWWRDQRLIGFTAGKSFALELRNCRVCESTLGRRCAKEEMVMSEPDGFWVSAEGYARLAKEQEAFGFLDLASYFYGRAADAAVAKFDEACARAELVGVDQVPEELEPTAVLPAPPNPWIEDYDGADFREAVHARAEAEAGR
jgi:hypothetical protein